MKSAPSSFDIVYINVNCAIVLQIHGNMILHNYRELRQYKLSFCAIVAGGWTITLC